MRHVKAVKFLVTQEPRTATFGATIFIAVDWSEAVPAKAAYVICFSSVTHLPARSKLTALRSGQGVPGVNDFLRRNIGVFSEFQQRWLKPHEEIENPHKKAGFRGS